MKTEHSVFVIRYIEAHHPEEKHNIAFYYDVDICEKALHWWNAIKNETQAELKREAKHKYTNHE